jgi:hypothetical protein
LRFLQIDLRRDRAACASGARAIDQQSLFPMGQSGPLFLATPGVWQELSFDPFHPRAPANRAESRAIGQIPIKQSHDNQVDALIGIACEAGNVGPARMSPQVV